MAIVEVAVIYVACGVGVAFFVLSREPRKISDALIALPLWPLLAPFLFLSQPPEAVTGLGALLPEASAVEPLQKRLAQAKQRLAEIDTLLSKPSFDRVALEAHLTTMAANDASPLALASARSRKRSIERLEERRKTLATELDELAELFLQLETQTEVVRLAGSADDSVSDLIADIQARLEGIDELEAETRYLS